MSSLLLQFQSLVSDVIKNRTELGCPTPCNTHEYRLTKSSLGTNTNVYRAVFIYMECYLDRERDWDTESETERKD